MQPEWAASIHFSDPAFASRVPIQDAYVLPIKLGNLDAAGRTRVACLASPWLLAPSMSATQNENVTEDHDPVSMPFLELVPLAWRCHSCGSLEIEQLKWRRPAPVPHSSPPPHQKARLSAAMQAKRERHQRRRERHEVARWSPMVVAPLCRQCFLCPRCGGGGDDSLASSAAVITTTPLSLSLTRRMRYRATCPYCYWSSYQDFSSVEEVITYLDEVMGDNRSDIRRDERYTRRETNRQLRRCYHGVGTSTSSPNVAQFGGLDRPLGALRTISEAAWETCQSMAIGGFRKGPTPPLPATEGDVGVESPSSAASVHKAVVLEQLRETERIARLTQRPAAPPAYVASATASDFAASLKNACSAAPQTLRLASPSTAEARLLARTQAGCLGIDKAVVYGPPTTVAGLIEMFQPAAVVAPKRKSLIPPPLPSADPAVVAGIAALHTPTSAYLHSLLRSDGPQTRPFSIPAYCIPKSPKEVVQGLAWRHGAAAHPNRITVLNFSPAADATAQAIHSFWTEAREKEVGVRPRSLEQSFSPERDPLEVHGDDEEGGDAIEATGDLGEDPMALRKSRSSKLPIPLFQSGDRYAAVGCLPTLQYVSSRRGDPRCSTTWTFVLMNLGILDVVIRDLRVVQSTGAVLDVVLRHTTVNTAISDSNKPAELPIRLSSRCCAAEIAALNGDDELHSSMECNEPSTGFATTAAVLGLDLVSPVVPAESCATPTTVYAGILVEVETPLPLHGAEAEHDLPMEHSGETDVRPPRSTFQYHSVQYGITVVLRRDME